MSIEMFQSIYQTLKSCGNGRRHFNILATKQKASKPIYQSKWDCVQFTIPVCYVYHTTRTMTVVE